MKINIWFFVRLLAWVLLAIVGPLVLILTQYDFFSATQTVSQKISGWGIIIIVIVFSGIYYVLSSVAKALPNPYLENVLMGILKVVLPLIIVYFLSGIIARNIDKIKLILMGSIIFQTLALFVNPLPEFIQNSKAYKLRNMIKEVDRE